MFENIFGPGTEEGTDMGDETKSERIFQRAAIEQNPQKGEDNYQLLLNNAKLTYDTVLQLLAAQAWRSQGHYDAVTIAERDGRQRVDNVSLQALQNAVETANMISKQAVRHNDVSMDRQWNKEPSEGAAESTILRQILSEPAQGAINAMIAQAVADAVKKVAAD